jgi:hypothetical protein
LEISSCSNPFGSRYGIVLVCAGWRVCLAIGTGEFFIVAIVGIAVIVILIAISIAAVQIIPTLELVQFSGAREGLVSQKLPFGHCTPCNSFCRARRSWGEFRLGAPVPWPARFFDQQEPYLLSCYVGAMTLLLAA